MNHIPCAIVTGAASGIGRSVACALAGQGYRVVLADLNREGLDDACRNIERSGGTAHSFCLDVTDDTALQELARFSLEQTGRIDLLVNNAGIQHVARLEDFPPDKWRLINNILLIAPVMLTRAVLPTMREQGFGRIVNIGSIHALVASPFKSAYVAAKHGLLGFSKVLALETADTDITINTICPAYVRTALVDKQIASQAEEHGISEDEVINRIMLEPMPKKSFIQMDEIIAAVNYLASPAARNVTGSQLVLDGAWIAK